MNFEYEQGEAASSDGKLRVVMHRLEAGASTDEGTLEFKIFAGGRAEGKGLRFLSTYIDLHYYALIAIDTRAQLEYFLRTWRNLFQVNDDLDAIRQIGCAISGMFEQSEPIFDATYVVGVRKDIATSTLNLPKLTSPPFDNYLVAYQRNVKSKIRKT